MKGIPKEELISILSSCSCNSNRVLQDYIDFIFEKYGDDYYLADSGYPRKWELTVRNEERDRLLK